MPKSQQNPAIEDIRQAYAAIVNYHNNLVQMRFTILGIFLATNGVLATGFFQSSLSMQSLPGLKLIGALLASLFWIIEVRTYQLLENLGMRGLDIEKHLGFHNDQGFFSLMDDQPIAPRLLPTQEILPKNRFISHSVWISSLYLVVGLVWLIMFIVGAYSV
jgi:hypothetical protein